MVKTPSSELYDCAYCFIAEGHPSVKYTRIYNKEQRFTNQLVCHFDSNS